MVHVRSFDALLVCSDDIKFEQECYIGYVPDELF